MFGFIWNADFCIFGFITGADHFSECVESHAFETYDKFIKAQGGVLRVLMLMLAWLHVHTYILWAQKYSMASDYNFLAYNYFATFKLYVVLLV